MKPGLSRLRTNSMLVPSSASSGMPSTETIARLVAEEGTRHFPRATLAQRPVRRDRDPDQGLVMAGLAATRLADAAAGVVPGTGAAAPIGLPQPPQNSAEGSFSKPQKLSGLMRRVSPSFGSDRRAYPCRVSDYL